MCCCKKKRLSRPPNQAATKSRACFFLFFKDNTSFIDLWQCRITTSLQPAILFSQNKPATNNQAAVLFSRNKSVSATNQTNRLHPSFSNGQHSHINLHKQINTDGAYWKHQLQLYGCPSMMGMMYVHKWSEQWEHRVPRELFILQSAYQVILELFFKKTGSAGLNLKRQTPSKVPSNLHQYRLNTHETGQELTFASWFTNKQNNSCALETYD
jgi:hypothetical protein